MNSNLCEKTSTRLYELRTSAGYTMEKLAQMLHVSKGTISKWEKGYIKNMRQDKVLMLANIYHVSPTYIMGYDVPDVSAMNNTINELNDFSKEEEIDERTKHFVNLYSQLHESEQIVVDKLLESLTSDK